MYTKNDYLKDLYLKEHAVREVERNAAATRCRLYEMGRQQENSPYIDEEYLQDLYLKEHATSHAERGAAETRARLRELGKVSNSESRETTENSFLDTTVGKISIILLLIIGIFLIGKLLITFVGFMFNVLVSTDNNANGGILFKSLMLIAPCITGIVCLIAMIRRDSEFFDALPAGIGISILFNWIIGGLYDMSNGQSLLATIIPGCFIYPFSALILQIFILPIFFLVTIIVVRLISKLK